jgi:hypothetical protein
MAKTFAIIENGVVVNLALAEDDWPHTGINAVPVGDSVVCIGDTYSSGVFTPKTVPVLPVEQITPFIEPVSPRQIRQAMTRFGIRANVELAVANGDQDLKDWYEYSTSFERVNPQVEAMGAALGVTEQQLNDLWTLAGTL